MLIMVVTLNLIVIDCFLEHIEEGYTRYCDTHGVTKTDKLLIKYMADQALPASEMYKYTLLREYERLMTSGQYNKTQIVALLSSKFSISVRTIWSVLKSTSKKHPVKTNLAKKTTPHQV